MSEIVIRRTNAGWQDRGRNYRVVVDGKELARVANDSSVKIPIAPGNHSVRLQIDWCQSPQLHVVVTEGNPLELECGPNSTPFVALIYVTLLRKRYIWLRLAQHEAAVPVKPAEPAQTAPSNGQ